MIDIEITPMEADNGDCDEGCWNSAYGWVVKCDGMEYDELVPWATCTDNSQHSLGDLIQLVIKVAAGREVNIITNDEVCI